METTAPTGSGAATSDADVKTAGNGAAAGQRVAPAPAPPLPPAAPLRSGALPQTFYNPTRLIWGEGSASQVGPHAAKLGAKKVLVVSDPGVVRAGIPKPVVDSITGAGLEAEVYDAVEPDPRIEIVEKALEHYTKGGFDVLVAVGGGSAMDTAKAAAILATNPTPLRQYEGWEKFPNAPAPLFALPTTVGTASEVTPFLVITDAAAKFKFTIGSPQAAPKIAFLDPLLVLGLPGNVTAATGMDALTHAIESYTSLLSTPISEGLALHAIRLLAANIRTAVANSHNVSAMNAMLVGANVAGLAFSNTRLGNVHACAHPLGAFWKIPHGVANALMLPHVMEFNALACPVKMIEIAQAMGEPMHIGVGGQTEYDAALRAAVAVRRMMADVGIPQRLRDLGVDKASIPDMAQDAMKSANIAINPRKTTINEIIGLYERAW
ncbi:MAG TPA: iron-containing alcohol dehydrogenase [Chloroflexota bacterium]|nr:iron-containing alcohol dehydrogenase [Chloroflexota bacterium]